MKSLILPLFMLIVSTVSAQKFIWYEAVTDHSLHIVGDRFNGVIFTQNFHEDIPRLDTLEFSKRYTPATDDILLAENILRRQIKKAIRNSRVPRDLDIYNSLEKYLRQYVGFINLKGQKVIFINFSIVKGWGVFVANDGHAFNIPDKPHWYEHFIEDSKADNSCWQVKINLETKKIYKFSVDNVL